MNNVIMRDMIFFKTSFILRSFSPDLSYVLLIGYWRRR